jgi:predicted carbohydrate-binding protein with CBM5 and CBM33 domain
MITQIEINGTKIPLVEVPDIENYQVLQWDLVDSGNGYYNKSSVNITAQETGWFEFTCRSYDEYSYLNASVYRNNISTVLHERRGAKDTILLVYEKVLKGDILHLSWNRLQTVSPTNKALSARFYPMKVF